LAGPVLEKIPVLGIFSTGIPEQERRTAFMDIAYVQQLLSMKGKYSRIAVYRDITQSASMARQVAKILERPDLEIMPWFKALPMLSQFIAYHNASVWLFQGIIFFIVSIIIMNGLFMAVLERTREIGVMRSIGMTGWQCFRLISYESLLLGIMALALGLGVGLTAVWYSHTWGINPTIFTGGEAIEIAGGSFSEKIYAEISFLTVTWTSVALILLAWIASLLPALRAANISPVNAMKRKS
ncbi:FtsX-like permease family protein, partial [Myxococcota bacterium]|nr:FtsX-like permease family protein [Myxococcota bacterium]